MGSPSAGTPDLADTAIEIGGFRLDAAGGILSRGGDVVPVRAKTFAFLCHLARNRGRVVTKDELFEAVWPGLFVSEDSLTQCASELRKLFGSGPASLLRTVPKRGYLLDVVTSPAPQAASGQAMPAIAILPFRNRSGNAADNVMIDGLVEEITYGLARFRSIIVVASRSAFNFPVDNRPPLEEIGARLRVGFVAEGAVTRVGGRLKVAVTLSDTASGQQLWGNQFDFAEGDLISMSAEIATTIISRLVSNIDQAFQRRSAPGPAEFATFENFVRGVALLRSYGPDVNERAKAHFERAIELDPACAVAHAYLALANVIIADYSAAPRAALEEACDRISLAITLEPEEARCHRIMGLVQLYLREHEAAEQCLRRAYGINPYDADAICQLGFVITMRGRPAEGLAWIERAIALNPFRPYWYDLDRTYGLYMLGRYDEMIAIIRGAPDIGAAHHLWTAAAFAMIGARRDAAAAIDKFQRTMGDVDVVNQAQLWTEYEQDRDFQHFATGLRAAVAAFRSGPGMASTR